MDSAAEVLTVGGHVRLKISEIWYICQCKQKIN